MLNLTKRAAGFGAVPALRLIVKTATPQLEVAVTPAVLRVLEPLT